MKSIDLFYTYNILKYIKKKKINLKNSVIGFNTANSVCFNDNKTLFLINILLKINTKLI